MAHLVTGPSASLGDADPFSGTSQPYRVDGGTGLQIPLPGRIPRQSGSGPWHRIVGHSHYTLKWLDAFRETNSYDALLVGLPARQNHIPSNGHTGQNQSAQFQWPAARHGCCQCAQQPAPRVHGRNLWDRPFGSHGHFQPAQRVLLQRHPRRGVHQSCKGISRAALQHTRRCAAAFVSVRGAGPQRTQDPSVVHAEPQPPLRL